MSKPIDAHSASGVIYQQPGRGIILVQGGAPTASAPGYSKGCLYLDVANGAVYYNTGTLSSATWTQLADSGA